MIALLALSALFSTASAQEGGYDAHGRALAATDGDPLDPLWGFRAERQLANSFGGAATLSFANAPLVRITTDGTDRTRERIVDDLLGVTLTGQFALHERVAIGLSAPVWFTSLSDAGRAGPALGEQPSEVAGAASEVDHVGGPLGAHAREQLDERAAAFVGEGQVALGIPGVHAARLS